MGAFFLEALLFKISGSSSEVEGSQVAETEVAEADGAME